MEQASTQGDNEMVSKIVRFLKKNALAIVLGIVATGFVVNGVLLSTSNVGVTIKGDHNTVTVKPPEIPAHYCPGNWKPLQENTVEHGIVYACEYEGWQVVLHEDGTFSHGWHRNTPSGFVFEPEGVPGWPDS